MVTDSTDSHTRDRGMFLTNHQWGVGVRIQIVTCDRLRRLYHNFTFIFPRKGNSENNKKIMTRSTVFRRILPLPQRYCNGNGLGLGKSGLWIGERVLYKKTRKKKSQKREARTIFPSMRHRKKTGSHLARTQDDQIGISIWSSNHISLISFSSHVDCITDA